MHNICINVVYKHNIFAAWFWRIFRNNLSKDSIYTLFPLNFLSDQRSFNARALLQNICTLLLQTYLLMELGTSKKLVVTDALGDHYIPLNQLICLIAKRGYCTIYFLNAQQQLQQLTATRTMNHYFGQTKGQLINIHRNACVNPRYVGALLVSQRVRFTVEGIETVRVADRKFRKVRAYMRQLAQA